MQYIPYKMRQGPPQNGPCREKSQNDADQTSASLVDDALQRLPHFFLGIRGHPAQLCLQVVAHDLIEAAAENVGLPKLAGVSLKLLEQVIHHVLGLLFIAYDRRYRGGNIGAYHVNRGGAGLHADAVSSALADDLRVLQVQVLHAGHYDAIAGVQRRLHGRGHPVILLPDSGQAGQQLHQVAVIGDGEAGLPAERLIKQPPRQVQVCRGDAHAQIQAADR